MTQMHEQATGSAAEMERITIVAREFTPAAMEFHRRRMGEQGSSIDRPIVRKRLFRIEGQGAPAPMLGGEVYYAVNFIRPKR